MLKKDVEVEQALLLKSGMAYSTAIEDFRVRFAVLFFIMARRKENDRAPQNNDDSDSNPNDELEDEPNFDDPEEYEDDISEQGKLFNKPFAIWLF